MCSVNLLKAENYKLQHPVAPKELNQEGAVGCREDNPTAEARRLCWDARIALLSLLMHTLCWHLRARHTGPAFKTSELIIPREKVWFTVSRSIQRYTQMFHTAKQSKSLGLPVPFALLKNFCVVIYPDIKWPQKTSLMGMGESSHLVTLSIPIERNKSSLQGSIFSSHTQ